MTEVIVCSGAPDWAIVLTDSLGAAGDKPPPYGAQLFVLPQYLSGDRRLHFYLSNLPLKSTVATSPSGRVTVRCSAAER